MKAEQERARAIVALAGEIDGETLGLLAPGAHDLLAADSEIARAGGRFTMDAAAARRLRKTLAEEAPGRYRALLEELATGLAGLIEEGQQRVEGPFTGVYEQLGSLLFADDTPAFLRLVAQTRDLPLQSPPARQWRAYFAAVAEFKRDRYDRAREAFDALLSEPALALAVRARATNARAVVCRLSGQPEEALAGYGESLALWRELEDTHYEAMVLMNMGILAYELRDYPAAGERLRQAERLFQEAGPGSAGWLAAVHNELGLLHRDLGQWQEALAYFERFRAARQAAGVAEDVALARLNMGEILLFQGRPEPARAALQEAKREMVTRTYLVDILLHLGLAAEALGEAAVARDHFREALATAKAIGRADILPHAYYHLGAAAARAGEVAEAGRLLARAATVIEETRAPLGDEQIKISLLGRWQQVYEALILHWLQRGRIAEAFAWAERARARAFADLAGAGEMDAVATAGEVQQALPAGTVVVAYFTTGVLAGDQPLLQQIAPGNPLRALLLLPPRTLLFVLTAEQVACYEVPLDPNLLHSHSARLSHHQRLLQPQVREQLEAALVAVAPEVKAAARLIVIPHGPLHHVPFAALLPDTLLSVAPSATFLVRQRSPATPPAQPGLAVGYDGQALKHTEEEVRMVAGLAGGEAWAGPEPKKEALREAARDRRWLHFACHGWFDEAQPLASYLETGQGERLSAHEVLAGWELTAELVVLSACQTGASAILRGDEPLGLVRAFLFAGAQSLLVSQWPVGDLATYLLMERFYGLLNEGASPPGALQQAQRWLRELTATELARLHPPDASPRLPSGSERPFAGPIHWAAFVLVEGLPGAPAP